MANPRCVLLVATCDARRDILGPTLASLAKHWPADLVPVRVISETGQGLGSAGLPVQTGVWCRQVEAAIEETDASRVILWLDDFILKQQVDAEKLRRAIELSEQRGCLRISRMPIPGGGQSTLEEVEHATGWPSRIAFQPSIWDPKLLAAICEKYETPWEVEAGQVELDRRFPDEFWCLADPIVVYKETTVRNKWTPIGLRLARRQARVLHVTREVWTK